MKTLSKAGRYELLEELGRGAMGVVYKANDPVIGRIVAVKTMRLTPEGTGLAREELISRFQTEARAAGLLAHPNIVVVYDAGEDEGVFHITMEYVDGRSLQALLDAKQSFPLPRVMRLMEQACSALEYAHQRNVVHRDIKPANLMLTSDDTVKITDFGTAKILQFGTTQTAHIIGTPSYMSPEQIKGKPVDGRSDIFSLGVILYELVTGEKPFPGQNITTVIYKIVNEDPIPPRELDSSVHPGLSAVITRALAKEPAARFASCGEFLEALKDYRAFRPGSVSTLVMYPREMPALETSAAPSPRRAAPPRAVAPAAATIGEAHAAKKRGEFWLALLLLAVIVGAGYRVWPYLRDVWQRSRAQITRQSQAPKPVQHAADATTPSAAPATSTATPEENNASPSGEKPVEMKPPAAPPNPGTEKHTAPRNPAEPPPNPAALTVKERMEQGLAAAGLADKVSIQVSGSTFTISGRLTPPEHRLLLRRLQNAPRWVRIVDHIEYAGIGTQPAPGGATDPRQLTTGSGAIEVLTDVSGAAAMLRDPQGRDVAACRTPCRFEHVRAGHYVLEVNLAGYWPVQRMLQLAAGGIVEERIPLEAASSGLYVTSHPTRALVFVNGERHPEPTPTTLHLPAGSYTITVRKPGFEEYTGEVQIKADQLKQLDVELARSRVAVGYAMVRSSPPGADILVDDAPSRQRTPARVQLTAGEHTLTLSLLGYPVARRTITVVAGKTVEVNVSLQ